MRTRGRILDAVETLLGSGGFRAVSVASVASEAGVSRQTIYSNFGTLEDLISEVVTEVSARTLAEINDRLDAILDPGEYAVELIVAARTQFRRTPALAVLVFPETGNPVFGADMLAKATPIAEVVLAPLFERAPFLADRSADVLEVLLRTGISVQMFDSDLIRSDADLRGYLTRTLLPALGLEPPHKT